MSLSAEAHAALLRNGALQFDLPPVSSPGAGSTLPQISFGFGNVGTVWVLAALVLAVVSILAIVHLRGRPPSPDAAAPAGTPAPVTDVPVAARMAVGDADGLAARGLFLDATRALLGCGLGAIAERHPGVVRPTSTSRDIVGEPALPEGLRLGLGRIARIVELGLFGGRAIGADDYADCRRAFVASGLGGAR